MGDLLRVSAAARNGGECIVPGCDGSGLTPLGSFGPDIIFMIAKITTAPRMREILLAMIVDSTENWESDTSAVKREKLLAAAV